MVQCLKGNNSKSIQSSVVVPMLCTSSQAAYHVCEVS